MEVRKIQCEYMLVYWSEKEDFEVSNRNMMHRCIEKDRGRLAYYIYIPKGESVIVKKDGKRIMYVRE